MNVNYNLLLEIVSKEISSCLFAIKNFNDYIKLNKDLDKFHYNWYKDIIRREKFKLKELKLIKRFLLFLKKMLTNKF